MDEGIRKIVPAAKHARAPHVPLLGHRSGCTSDLSPPRRTPKKCTKERKNTR